VLIYSNTDLPEFGAQTEKLRRVPSYDNASRSWYGQIPFDRPEWAAEMLTALFDTARLHGTDIRVQTPPPAAPDLVVLPNLVSSVIWSVPAASEPDRSGGRVHPP
jgi:hypothetical protein